MAPKKPDVRIMALRRFALSITGFNILGHALFGFEQAWLFPLGALAVAYGMSMLLEWLASRALGYGPRFMGGGVVGLIDFLLPAHISALAIAMLIYPNARIAPILFAVAVCIGSKYLFRVPIGTRVSHFLNPSNFGISVTLILFPWVGIAPPYHFTENLTGIADWIVPAIILISGGLLNTKLTRRHPLILAWLAGFVVQAVVRQGLFGGSLLAMLTPMSGVAFLLFTFYMISDPGTTPFKPRDQIWFGFAVAAVYGLLVSVHIVFGLFFALTLVSGLRGLKLYAQHLWQQRSRYAQAPSLEPSLKPLPQEQTART